LYALRFGIFGDLAVESQRVGSRWMLVLYFFLFFPADVHLSPSVFFSHSFLFSLIISGDTIMLLPKSDKYSYNEIVREKQRKEKEKERKYE